MARTKLEVVIDAKDRATGKMNKLQSSIGKVRGSLNKFTPALLGAGAAITGLGVATKKAIDAFAKQEQAEARLTGALRNVEGMTQRHIDGLKDYAAQLQKVTTFGDEQIISAQAMLGTFQMNDKEIRQLTPRILDMAASLEKTSGATVDLEQITIAMGKVVGPGGTAGALKRYGVAMTEAQQAQFNMAEGMDKVNLLSEILDQNFKGIAEESAKTATGKIRQMENAMGDLQEQFGAVMADALLPFIKSLTEWAQKEETQEKIRLIALTLVEVGHTLKTIGGAFVKFGEIVGSAIAWPIEQFIKLSGWLDRVSMKVSRFKDETLGRVSGFVSKMTSWIPGLQEGGIVTKPTLAMVGEKGPEAVIPLDNTNKVAGNTYNFDFRDANITDKEQLINDIKKAINRESELRSMGGV